MNEAIHQCLRMARPGTAAILEGALQGHDLVEDEIVALLSSVGADFRALVLCADYLRRQTVGDDVTYVVNRNINFTNVCVKRCGFCAFSRTYRNREGYYLPLEEVVERARQAFELGATEVCIQAGLPPEMEGGLYLSLCRAVKEKVPQLHIHAFSPEEILYGSERSGLSIRAYLSELKDAGIGSLPGTSAEILDQEVRDRISPGRISVREWIQVICTAHDLGIPTTSTMMYGHVEGRSHRARHLLLLRDLQRQSGGFTEFVPLSFIHTEAPMYREGRIKGVQAGASGLDVVRLHAVSRLVLNRDIPNVQVSWVKEGLRLSQLCLRAGANDMGGTLVNESISTAAGAPHGQLVRPLELRRSIRQAGGIPVERSTLYRKLRRYPTEKREPLSRLDRLTDEEVSRLGSYRELTQTDRFRFSAGGRQHRAARPPVTGGRRRTADS